MNRLLSESGVIIFGTREIKESTKIARSESGIT